MKDYNKNKDYRDYQKGHRIAEDIGRLVNLNASHHEHLDKWLKDEEHSKELINKLSSEQTLTNMCNQFDYPDKYAQSEKLIKELNQKRSKISRLRIIKVSSISAAAALMFVSFTIYMFSGIEKELPTIAEKITTTVINSEFEKPTLVRTGGETIDLTEIAAASLVKVEQINNNATSDSTILYNTVFIPAKYNYKLELEDGTIVHLNSCSELRYPNNFNGDKREVFLRGEAFFEVKKDSKPFIVNINDISVRVYGTKFNINTYNIRNIQTALIEGSVSVKQLGDTIETFIKPNQLLTVDQNRTKSIRNICPERYTAWMDGFIRSDDEPLSNLLTDMANWYRVEFAYDQRINDIIINASLDRERPLEELISAIEMIAGVKIVKKDKGKYMIE